MTQDLPNKNSYITVSETAKMLGVSIDTVRRWDANGILTSTRLDGKNRYFLKVALREFKKNQPLSISEAAKALSVSVSTLRRLEGKGVIVADRSQNGERLYSPHKIREIINSRKKSNHERFDLFARSTSSGQAGQAVPALSSTAFVQGILNKPDTQGGSFQNDQGKSFWKKNHMLKKIGHFTAINSFGQSPKSLRFHGHVPDYKRAIGSVAVLLFLSTAVFGFTVLKDTGIVGRNPQEVLSTQTGGLDILAGMSPQKRAEFGQVLAAGTVKGKFIVNVESLFNENIKTNNKNADLGTGELTASNVVYSVTGGPGITILGTQDLTASNSGILTIGGTTGDIALGTGLTVSGNVLASTGGNSFSKVVANGTTISAGSSTDTLTFAAGSNISLSASTGSKTITISSTAAAVSGWTLSGTSLYPDSTTYTVGIGNTNPTATLDVTGTLLVSGAITFSNLTSNGGVLYTNGSGVISQTATGTGSQCLLGGATPSFGSCNSGSADLYWTQGSGLLSPNNSTVDFTIGGQSTAAAKFGLINVNSGTPAIQISGGTVLTATTLGSTVVSSSLTSVGALASGTIASGFGTIATANTITGTTLNGTTGINTGAVAGTQRIDSSGNLVNIGTTQFNTVTYTWPSSDTGLSGYALTTNGSGTLSWVASGGLGTNYWAISNGLLYPQNGTLDFSIGGSTTASAKFAVINVNTGTPTATLSAGAAGGAYLTATGTLSTTAMQTLTLGSATTGNILLSGFSTGIVHSSSTGILSSSPVVLSGAEVSGVLTVAKGGTGQDFSATAQGSVPYFNATGVMAALAPGTVNYCLTTGGAGANPSYQQCALGSGTNWFEQSLGLLYPINSTVDFAIGGQTTASAKFAVINVNTGTPTATLSAGAAGGAYLNATGTLSTTAMQTLTLGTSTTGNIVLDSGTSVITLSDPTTASSTLTTTGTLTANGTFAANGIVTLGDGGDNFSVASNALDISTAGAISGATSISASSTITFSTFTSDGGVLYTNGSGVLAQATAGTSSQCLLGGTTPSFGSCATGGVDAFWAQSLGLLYANNSTVDFSVGGQTTASAKFAVINVNTGTPTASISANTANNATFLTGLGNLATTNTQNITIGGTTSGNIALNPLNSTGIVTVNGGLTVTGNTILGDSNTADTLTGNLLTTSITSGATSQDVITITGSSLTTGTALTLVGPTGTGITDHFVKISSGIGSATSLLNLNPDFIGAAVTGYGIYNLATDATGNANTDYGYYGSLALTGNAGKTGVGLYSTVTSSSTTSDTLVALDLATSVTGILTAGTDRAIYGLRSQPDAGAESVGGSNTTVYGIFSKASGDTGASAQFTAYGAFIANGTYDTDGTSTAYGLYVDSITGADSNYTAVFAGGNVGIGDTSPGAPLEVGDGTDSIQISSVGDITFVDANGAATITGPAGGALNINAANSTNLALGTTTAGNITLTTAATAGLVNVLTGNLKVGAGTPTLSLNGDDAYVTGTFEVDGISNLAGAVTFGSTTTLGSGAVVYTWPAADASVSGYVLSSNAAGALSWVAQSGGSSSPFKELSGAIVPLNSTEDFLVGGTTTESAKFAVINVNTGTPTASLSAGAAGGAYLTATGTLATTAMQALTLGTATTGNIIFSNYSTGIIHSSSTGVLSSSAVVLSGTDVSGVLTVAKGGTGQDFSATVQGAVPYFNGTGVMAALAPGTINYCLTTGGAAANPSWQSCALGGVDAFWGQSSGLLYANNSTVDFAVGGQSSTAAKFVVLNLDTGTPTASISANTTGNNTYLTGLGNLATTNMQTLSLGGATTGNITATPGFADGLVNVLTGSLKVGNGTPGVTLNGEDAYIEGTLEVDGNVNLAGSITTALTASRFVVTDGSSVLAATANSAALLNTLTDATGTGVAVFGTSPTFTTSVVTGSSSFNVFNATATTINAFGAATTLELGAASGTTSINNALTVDLATQLSTTLSVGGVRSTSGYPGNSAVDFGTQQIWTSDTVTDFNTKVPTLTLMNSNTTTNNMTEIVFASRNSGGTDVGYAAIVGIAGTRTASFYPGSLAFYTGGPTTNFNAEKMRLDSTGLGIKNTSPVALLTLGTAGTTAGNYSLAGATSGTVTVDVAAAAGTWTLTLPTTDGTSGQVLITDGDGNTSWSSAGSATFDNQTDILTRIGANTDTTATTPVSLFSRLAHIGVTADTGANATLFGRLGSNTDNAQCSATSCTNETIFGVLRNLPGQPLLSQFSGDGSNGAIPASGALTPGIYQYTAGSVSGVISPTNAATSANSGLFLFVQGTLTIASGGNISVVGYGANGGNGGNGIGGAASSAYRGIGGGPSSGSGTNGGNAAAGLGGNASLTGDSLGGAGGGGGGGGTSQGGAGGGASGGNGGNGGAASTAGSAGNATPGINQVNFLANKQNLFRSFGAGGGGGAGDNGGGGPGGGGGGGGGGVIWIRAHTYTNNGGANAGVVSGGAAGAAGVAAASANTAGLNGFGQNGATAGNGGGAGGNVSGGNGGGGGGGAGGGVLYIEANTIVVDSGGSISAAGGAGGNGGNSGNAGTAGAGGAGAAGFLFVEIVP